MSLGKRAASENDLVALLQPAMDAYDGAWSTSQALLQELPTNTGAGMKAYARDVEDLCEASARTLGRWIDITSLRRRQEDSEPAQTLSEYAQWVVATGEHRRAALAMKRLRNNLAHGQATADPMHVARVLQLDQFVQEAVQQLESAATLPTRRANRRRVSWTRSQRPGRVVTKLVSWAAGRLSSLHRSRYEGEWNAELHDLPRRQRLAYVLRLLLRARSMRRALAFVPADELEHQAPWESR